MNTGRQPSDWAIYCRILRLARPYRTWVAGILLFSLLTTPLALLYPLPLKIAVDSVIGSEPLPSFLGWIFPAALTWSTTALLLGAVGLVVLIDLLTSSLNLAENYLRTLTGERLALEFRALLFRHAQRLSLSYHDTKGTADSLYRIQWDAEAIKHIAIDGVIPFFTALVTLVSMMVVIIRLDWQLALVALTVSPVFFWLMKSYCVRLRDQWKELKQIDSAAVSVVQEVLAAVRVVKAFGQETREQGRYRERSHHGIQARRRLTLVEGVLNSLMGLTIAVGTAGVLLIGVNHVQAGLLTLGELLLVIGYLTYLYGPLKVISSQVVNLQSHLTSAERAFALLDEAPEVPERPDAHPLARAQGAVRFENVSFDYGRGQPAVAGVSFEVTPGMRLGIAGVTGAGKTTLLSLLTRFYDPTGGRICLDDRDICEYRLRDLRDQFAIVLQDAVLFSTTIAENIGYGRTGAGEAEIVAAAQAANVHEFIVKLPQGYNTPVGERGLSLSGGERQRIALARAFLKDAPILILDEPTSSVDINTEAVIMEAMERLMRGRTTFLIAHRLSTLKNCDRILVLEAGRVVAVQHDAGTVVKRAVASGRMETLTSSE